MSSGDRGFAEVALVDSGRDPLRQVRRAMEAAGWENAIPSGCEIALKPNLGWDLFLPGAVTSPLIVEGVVQVLRDRARKIYLVEADQVLVDCETALGQTRMDRLCRRYNLEWINLSREPLREVKVENPLHLPALRLREILTRTVLVTVPVMKTHNKTVLSGAIKNQWGCLPTFRHNYHPVVHEVLRDLATVLPPAFCVMDATVALEGNGPKSGIPRICNLILASSDPVALDTVSGELMGVDHLPIRHLQLCAEAGIGVHDRARIRVINEDRREVTDLPRFDFRLARHNTVSLVETILRGSMARRLIFETPVLDLLCLGAKAWYLIWYYLIKGRRLRDWAIAASPYGSQWASTPPPSEAGDGAGEAVSSVRNKS